MKKEIDTVVKNYFEQEVSAKKVPQMPVFQSSLGSETQKKDSKLQWDNLFLAACVLGSFFLIIQPSIYDNTLRNSYIPMNEFNAFKEEVPRVIFDAFKYFKEKNLKESL